MEIIQPIRQKAWGWPAAVNFILGGMGAGFYLLSMLTLVLWGEPSRLDQAGAFKSVGPALTVFGLAALGLEAGRPLRSRYLLSHLQRSWMSRETLAAALFVTCALLDLFFPSAALRWCAAVAAAGFLLSQSLLVYRSRGITAWNVPLLPLLFLFSGLAMGGGLLLLSSSWGRAVSGRGVPTLVLALIGLDLAVWLFYLFGSRKRAFWRTTRSLRHSTYLLITVGIGHILPALLLLPAATMSHPVWGVQSQNRLLVLAGLAVIAGGAALKAGVIVLAGYLRGVDISREEVSDPPDPVLVKRGENDGLPS